MTTDAIGATFVTEEHDATAPHGSAAQVDKAGEGIAEEVPKKEKKIPASAQIIELIKKEGIQPWRDKFGTAYLTVKRDGHQEHYRVISAAAQDYLRYLYYQKTGLSLSGQVLHEISELLQTRGRVDGKEYVTGLRTVHFNGRTYLDLGDPTWRMIEVSTDGWQCIASADSPVRFTRSQGMQPLPVPCSGGTLTDLRKFLNVDDNSYILCTAWLVGAISGIAPYPLLAIGGEEGSGKSTLATVLKRFVDPHEAERRRPPKNERDLFVASQSTSILIYDNLHSIPDWFSDALCVLSTGGAFSARTLYSNDEETVLRAQRPVIVNGIADLLARPDLAERALTLTLRRIIASDRRPEAEFWREYEERLPLLLGGLLTALSTALQRIPDVTLQGLPRLADFARLVIAAEPGLPWRQGEFLSVYGRMQRDAVTLLLDDEPVAEAIRDLIDDVGQWQGTVKALQKLLGDRLAQPGRPPQGWPATPKALGGQLRRLAAALSKVGYHVVHVKRSNQGEIYELRKGKGVTYVMPTVPDDSDQDAEAPF